MGETLIELLELRLVGRLICIANDPSAAKLIVRSNGLPTGTAMKKMTRHLYIYFMVSVTSIDTCDLLYQVSFAVPGLAP